MFKKSVLVILCICAATWNPSLDLLAQNEVKQSHQPPPLVTIFIWDNSESEGTRATSPTTLAAIEYYCTIAQLARDPTAVAAIVFNSDQDHVGVVGDANGQLTTNLNVFLRELRKVVSAPAGVSPLDIAFEKVLELVQGLPPEADIQVILFSNGKPRHSRLKPELYESVKAELEAVERRLAQTGDSPDYLATQKQLILRGRGADGIRLFEKQDAAQLERCRVLVESLAARGIRFVSISDGHYTPLRDIHDAANGTEDDWIISPVHETIRAVRERRSPTARGLMDFPFVLRDQREFTPDQDADIEATVELDSFTQRVVGGLIFKSPVTDFDENVTLSVRLGGDEITIRQDSPDESSRVLMDASGKAVGIAFSFDGLTPQNRTLTMNFSMRSGATSMPPATLYLDMRVRDDVQFILKPTTSQATRVPPHRVEPDAPLLWEAYFINESQERLPFKGISGGFIDERTGDGVELTMTQDPREEGLFVSGELALDEGSYAALIRIETLDGHEFTITLNRHVLAVRHLWSVILTPSFTAEDSSPHALAVDRAKRMVFWGTVGDATERIEHTYFVGIQGADEPVALEIRCVNVQDAAGKEITPSFIRPARSQLNVMPGKVVRVRFLCELPEQLNPEIVDGPITFQIQFVRQDVGTDLPVEPGRYSGQIADVSKAVVILKRPQIYLRAYRETAIAEVPQGRESPATYRSVPADLPATWEVPIFVSTNSVKNRTVLLPATINLLDTNSKSSIVGLEMSRIFPEESEIEVPAGQSVKTIFRITAPEAPRTSFTGEIRSSGNRLLDGVLIVDGRLPENLLSPKFRTLLFYSCCGAVAVVLIFAGLLSQLRRFLPEQTVLLTSEMDDVCGLQVERRGVHQMSIESHPDYAYQWRRGADRYWSELSSGTTFDTRSLGQQKPHIGKVDDKSDDEQSPHDLIVKLERAFFAGPGDVTVEGTIQQSLKASRLWKRRTSYLVGALIISLMFAGGHLFFGTERGFRTLQSILDRWPALQTLADFIPAIF